MKKTRTPSLIVAAFSAVFILFTHVAHSQLLYDVYVVTSARGTMEGALTSYQYDSGSNTVQEGDSYNFPLGNGASARNFGALSLSGDRQSLVFASYVSNTNYINLFDLADRTLSNVADTPRSGSQSTFDTVWSQSGTNFYATGNNNGTSPGYFETGSTTSTSLWKFGDATAAAFESITYYEVNDRFYVSRSGASNSGVWQFNAPGFPTSAPESGDTATLLTGEGWVHNSASGYGGFAFYTLDDISILFIANRASDTIDIFANVVGGDTNQWNFQGSKSTVTGGLGVAPLQLSLVEDGDGSVRLFFTTNTANSGSAGTSAFGTVPWNLSDGFGDVTILASSTSVMFTGIVAVIPEPSVVALLLLGVVFGAGRKYFAAQKKQAG